MCDLMWSDPEGTYMYTYHYDVLYLMAVYVLYNELYLCDLLYHSTREKSQCIYVWVEFVGTRILCYRLFK